MVAVEMHAELTLDHLLRAGHGPALGLETSRLRAALEHLSQAAFVLGGSGVLSRRRRVCGAIDASRRHLTLSTTG